MTSTLENQLHAVAATGSFDIDKDMESTSAGHHEHTKSPSVAEYDHTAQYLTGIRLWLALIGMMLGELVTGLGGNMLSPAFVAVANNFQAAQFLGWIGAAFFMTQSPSMLLYGQLLSIFDGKYVFMVSIGLFSLGSIICGSAQNVEAVIAGRAISGLGAAGIWVAVLALVAVVAPLPQRPKILGIFGLVNALSAGVGPVLAGRFADLGLWRLCFLFVLPIAAIALLVIFFTIPSHSSPPLDPVAIATADRRWNRFFSNADSHRTSFLYRLLSVDWIGFLLVMASIICLEIAIQWGGSTYPWVSGQVLGMIIGGFGGLFGLFILWEMHEGESAVMPTRLFRNRTQWGACILAFLTLYSNLIGVIMLPYFFEVVLGHTATQAGYEILPYLLVTIVFSLITGLIVTKTGAYFYWLLIGSIFTVSSGAAFYKITEFSGAGAYYGYQILIAAGVGFTQQQIYIAIQADTTPDLVHRRIAAVSFTQLFGGALAPTISISILTNSLTSNLAKYAPTAPATVLRDTTSIKTLPTALQAAVIKCYMLSLNNVFVQLCGLGGATLIISVLLIRNINLKTAEKAQNEGDKMAV
ncbi:MFS general substrate transporter [Meredithblackwellia eburnea MCA 4105]